MLTNIQMCLYLLDYYEGHAWAANKMRDAEISDLVRRGATQPASI